MNLEIREQFTIATDEHHLFHKITDTKKEAEDYIANEMTEEDDVEHAAIIPGYLVFDKDTGEKPDILGAFHFEFQDAQDDMNSHILNKELSRIYNQKEVIKETRLKAPELIKESEETLHNLVAELTSGQMESLYNKFKSDWFCEQIFEGEDAVILLKKEWFIFEKGTKMTEIDAWFDIRGLK